MRTPFLIAALLLSVICPTLAAADADREAAATKLAAKAVDLLGPGQEFDEARCGLIGMYLTLGQLDEAVHQLQLTKGQWPSLGAAVDIAAAQVRAGDRAGAVATAKRFTNPGDSFSTPVFIALQAIGGDFDQCEKAITSLEDIQARSNSMTQLACVQYTDGKLDLASRNFAGAANAIIAGRKQFDYWTVGQIALAQYSCGDHEGAAKTLQRDPDVTDALMYAVKIATRDYKPADRDKVIPLLDKLSRALQVTPKQINDPVYDPGTSVNRVQNLMTLIDCWITVGQTEKAKQALGKMATSVGEDRWSIDLCQVALETDKIGDKVSAIGIFDRMFAGIPKAGPDREESLWILASTEAQSSRWADAPRIANLAIKAKSVDIARSQLMIDTLITGTATFIAQQGGPNAEWSWVEAFPTAAEKAAVYAAGANGMISTLKK